ncbi:MAG: hypothetical protein ACKO2P_02465 [Planctomycetota bacterium]
MKKKDTLNMKATFATLIFLMHLPLVALALDDETSRPETSTLAAAASPTGETDWSLDEAADALILHGNVQPATGAYGKSLVLDGESLIELRDTARLHSSEFTIHHRR